MQNILKNISVKDTQGILTIFHNISTRTEVFGTIALILAVVLIFIVEKYLQKKKSNIG